MKAKTFIGEEYLLVSQIPKIMTKLSLIYRTLVFKYCSNLHFQCFEGPPKLSIHIKLIIYKAHFEKKRLSGGKKKGKASSKQNAWNLNKVMLWAVFKQA